MSAGLRAAARDYLSERRARGYRLDDHEWLLGAFLDGLEARGATRITVAGALAFATARPETSRCWQAKRLAVVREFAWYVHGTDPAAAEPVPAGLINARTARRVPYLYSEEQIARLMSGGRPAPGQDAGGQHADPDRAASEHGPAQRGGRRPGRRGPRRRRAAADRDRQVRQDPARRAALHDGAGADGIPADPGQPGRPRRPAAHRRDRAPPEPDDGPHIFRSLTRQCRLAPQPGCGAPRLHDFRHRFAVNTLIDAHRQGRDVDACIAVLATHLGHVSPVHTYWYLTVTPELADAVSERVALYYQQGRRQ